MYVSFLSLSLLSAPFTTLASWRWRHPTSADPIHESARIWLCQRNTPIALARTKSHPVPCRGFRPRPGSRRTRHSSNSLDHCTGPKGKTHTKQQSVSLSLSLSLFHGDTVSSCCFEHPNAPLAADPNYTLDKEHRYSIQAYSRHTSTHTHTHTA